MRLTKTQQFVMDTLKNGGHIWYAGEFPYLAVVREDGWIKSDPLKKSVADRLKALGLLTRVEGRNKWVAS